MATKNGHSMKNALKHLLFIIGILIINFTIKNILLKTNLDFGPIRISLVFNSGFIFGLYNEASYIVRIVVTAVMVGILSLIACYFYEFLHPSLKRLRWGITLCLSGVVGNSLEKLLYGYVWDFISINPTNIAFNINDVLQILGLIILISEIFKNQHVIWFPEANRKRRITVVYKEIQLPILFKIMGLIFIGSITQAILTVALIFPHLKRGSQDVQVIFFLCLFLLNLAILPLLGRYLLKELLRCLGPIYALEKFLNNEQYENKELKFRKTDHFQSLEEAFNKFLKKVSK